MKRGKSSLGTQDLDPRHLSCKSHHRDFWYRVLLDSSSMARPSTPPILTRLCTASSANAQAAALRELKHEIIGTEQKKVSWIKLGLVPHLLQVLSSESSSKRSNRAAHAYRDDGSVSGDETEDARLQATIIIGSLAHGESIFLMRL